MLPLASLDLEVMLSLAAVFWLHGWRRASGDLLIAAHAPVVGWWVREPFARTGPLILATWFPALVVSLVVTPTDGQAAAPWQQDFDLAVARGRRRLGRARWWVLGLRLLAMALIVWTVVGVPLAVARFGVTGLAWSLIGALLPLALLSVCTGLAMWRLGSTARKAWMGALTHIGPFSAIFAAESVLEHALAGLGAPQRLATLLGERRFLEWIRPWAFDVRCNDRSRYELVERVASLLAGIPVEVLDRSTRVIPRDGDAPASRYCPRCASAHLESVPTCASCDGVFLVFAQDAQRETRSYPRK